MFSHIKQIKVVDLIGRHYPLLRVATIVFFTVKQGIGNNILNRPKIHVKLMWKCIKLIITYLVARVIYFKVKVFYGFIRGRLQNVLNYEIDARLINSIYKKEDECKPINLTSSWDDTADMKKTHHDGRQDSIEYLILLFKRHQSHQSSILLLAQSKVLFRQSRN
jgi:hypothetical protein